MGRMVGRFTKLKSILLFAFCLLHFANTTALALDIDPSIDDDIRRNYNPNKIIDDMGLPPLPKAINENNYKPAVYPQKPVNKPVNLKKVNNFQATVKKIDMSNTESYAVLKSGTKIKVKLLNYISDKSKKGTRVSFISEYPVTTTYFTIPMGTVFQGEIINSHRPQFTGNGGLIVVKINSVILNSSIKPINAKVTKVDSKMIFLNNIKGQRKYLSSVLKSMNPGKHFFAKMIRLTAELAAQGSSAVLTPFSVAAGVVALGSNIIASPVTGLFYKGGSIYIPEGTNFEIKLTQDMYITN